MQIRRIATLFFYPNNIYDPLGEPSRIKIQAHWRAAGVGIKVSMTAWEVSKRGAEVGA